MITVQNFINGQFEKSEKFIDSHNPATGEVWALIPDSGSQEVDDAVTAAEAAFPAWSALDYSDRARYLFKIADIIDERLEEFALAESKDQGKPVKLARTMDIPRASHNFRTFAQAWQHLVETANVVKEQGVINYSVRHPIGIAGNTVVCKPSEMTSVTAWMLCQVCQQAGLPQGVVNMVFGYGHTVGEAIVTHPQVRVISFTGSTGVGQHIARTAAPLMKKISLELGGKNAAVIFDDADLDKCVQGVVRSSFLNQGEICLCTSRIFVQEGIYEKFVEKYVEEAGKLKTGDPLNEENFLGAVNSKIHYDKVQSYVKLAETEGGTIVLGENTKSLELVEENKNGWFVPPTIITGLPDSSRCMQEEIFGPVVCVTSFTTEQQVIQRVNNTRYGLCASVWSENVGRIHRMGLKLEVGTVWANCWLKRCLDMPFGGCKLPADSKVTNCKINHGFVGPEGQRPGSTKLDSGTGREGTRHSLEAFTEEKTVCVQIF